MLALSRDLDSTFFFHLFRSSSLEIVDCKVLIKCLMTTKNFLSKNFNLMILNYIDVHNGCFLFCINLCSQKTDITYNQIYFLSNVVIR